MGHENESLGELVKAVGEAHVAKAEKKNFIKTQRHPNAAYEDSDVEEAQQQRLLP